MYIVIKTGVYWNDIHGIFSNPAIAIEKAKEVLSNEPDDYHSVDIYEFVPDKFYLEGSDGCLICSVIRKEVLMFPGTYDVKVIDVLAHGTQGKK